jgi:hypothetical protein
MQTPGSPASTDGWVVDDPKQLCFPEAVKLGLARTRNSPGRSRLCVRSFDTHPVIRLSAKLVQTLQLLETTTNPTILRNSAQKARPKMKLFQKRSTI